MAHDRSLMVVGADGGRLALRAAGVDELCVEGAFPGGETYLSMPGLGDRLAARVAGEIGEYIEQFTSPNALQCYAGRAPLTRRSGGVADAF
jgi:transposase